LAKVFGQHFRKITYFRQKTNENGSAGFAGPFFILLQLSWLFPGKLTKYLEGV
jgi:hypothetical protein